MTKKKKQKGFTLVELLVVIAIIAILATVSVVGYISFTKKAKESNDTVVVSNINSLLQADEALNGKPSEDEAFTRVVDVAEAGGYLLENLTPMSEGDILYDLESNRCLLVNISETKIVYQDSTTDIEASEVLAKLQGTDDDDTLYFIYATDETVDTYKCLYQKVDSTDDIKDAFTNSQKGVVIDGTIKIDSSATIDYGSENLTLVAASGETDPTQATSGIYIKKNKIFRIAEGATVTVESGTSIVHDGQILVYGTLELLSSEWYMTYYVSSKVATREAYDDDPDTFDINERLVIKSTGYLYMPGSIGGFRTAAAEEGAHAEDNYFVWVYTGEGWKVESCLSATETAATGTTLSSTETQNYIWKWVVDDDTIIAKAGTAYGGHWERKSTSGGNWETCDGSTILYACGYTG